MLDEPCIIQMLRKCEVIMVSSNSIIVVINPFSQEVCVVKPSMACDLCYR